MTDGQTGDRLLKLALQELYDVNRLLERLDRRTPVDFFVDRGLVVSIETYLATRNGG